MGGKEGDMEWGWWREELSVEGVGSKRRERISMGGREGGRW